MVGRFGSTQDRKQRSSKAFGMVMSLKVANYSLEPEMQRLQVTHMKCFCFTLSYTEEGSMRSITTLVALD
ncbi:hypothetical protein TanjilG_22239 [Lupinus angustifolius]|uniref:Uncharacterized protein n=1 Tax=Lupinus angustifolius TaxID=3871 RepID=A0A1J7HSS4_LUPAN|nr:hypothetical protein TanjilG_22239 [Lupinus angustifolius]